MQITRELFNQRFSSELIKEYYFKKIRHKAIPGLDKITRSAFEKELMRQIDVISRKVFSGRYKFTNYKEKLILKGRNKLPRLISMPTIRDKITLGIINEILSEKFRDSLKCKLVKSIIGELKEVIESNRYDYYIKLDIQSFYPTIDHKILLKRIKSKIRYDLLLKLIISAIQTPSQSIDSRRTDRSNDIGVPEGLSISNILANIYLSSLDKKYMVRTDLKYFRYVDDILILCNKDDHIRIIAEIDKELKSKYRLKINQDKKKDGGIKTEFQYLGYLFKDRLISVRDSSKMKIEHKIQKIFSNYVKNKKKGKMNAPLFIWELNLRITGCINGDRKYGWLFFFSQINDLSLLYHLDWFVDVLFERYNLQELKSRFPVKKFARTFFEINYNIKQTKYIPNFSTYNQEDKQTLLRDILNESINGLSDDQIDELFNKAIYKRIKDLEEDMQNLS